MGNKVTGTLINIRYRLAWLLGGSLYFVWGLAYRSFVPDTNSSLLGYGLVLGFATVFVTGSLFSAWMSRHHSSFHLLLSALIMFHVTYVLAQNNFAPMYLMGSFITMFCIYATLSSRRDLHLFSAVILALAGLSLRYHGEVPGVFIAFGFLTILMVCNITALDRMRTMEALVRNERLLTEASARMTSVLESVREGFITLDRNLCFTYANREAEKLMNTKNKNYIGQSVQNIFPGLMPPDMPAGTVDTLYQERVFHHEPRKMWCETRLYSSPHGISIFLRDVTEKRNLEEIVQEQSAKALMAAKMSTLGEMAAGIAHEINNPLAIIQGRAQQVLSALDSDLITPEFLRNNMERIEATVTRIGRIVKSLRSFARDGEQDPVVRVTVQQVLDDALDLCRERFQNNGVELRLAEFPKDIVIPCRPVQVTQVLLNLLSNAFDAIKENSAQGWVRVSCEVYANAVALTVTNPGKPIPLEVQAKLFQPFFTTKGVGRGTGLGLSISKGIAESQGGELTFTSNAQDTSFTLILPARRVEPQAISQTG